MVLAWVERSGLIDKTVVEAALCVRIVLIDVEPLIGNVFDWVRVVSIDHLVGPVICV